MTPIPRLWVPTPTGRVLRSTGTRDRATVNGMRAMLDALGPFRAQAWPLLEAVEQNVWDLRTLYRHWEATRKSVPQMTAILHDIPLADRVEPWLSSLSVAPESVERYRVHVGAMLETLTHRSDLTPHDIAAWLDGLPVSSGTKRRYAAAVSSFCRWLVLHRHLDANPVRDIPKPKAGRRRDRWITTAEAMRLADAQPSPYREFSALLAATGLDVSALLRLTRGSVDGLTIQNRRPKTGKHHTVIVAGWAEPYLKAACAGKMPGARLFAGLDRWRASDHHHAACQALGIDGYTQRDARHTCAVRLAQAGMPMLQIAEQLGHSNAQLVTTVYAVHAPPMTDRLMWERVAQERDAKAG